MKTLLIALLIVTSALVYSQNPNNEYHHRAKIYYQSSGDLNQLSALGIPLDHGIHKKGVYIESDFSQLEIDAARKNGNKVEITINNVQQFYKDQNDPKSIHYVGEEAESVNLSCSAAPITYTTPVNYNNGSMGGYLTYSEMLQELDDMKRLYPNLITTRANISTFKTSQGRAIQYVKISDNPSVNESSTEPQMLYTAIHHAREPLSLQQTIFYMWYLLENYSKDDEIKAIVENTELFFVPCINPDGYIHNETTNPRGGGLWRKNRRNNGRTIGVDNNRNYSYIAPNGKETWNTVGTSGPNGGSYAGTAPFSEPENKAIRWLVEQNNFKMAINAHSFGNLLLYPFAYTDNKPTPEDPLFKAVSEFLVSDNDYNNIITSNLYAAAGASDDFMYGELTTTSGDSREKVYAMTPEIGTSFWEPASKIISTCKNMMFLNLSAAQTIQNFALLTETTESLFIETTSATIDYRIQRIGLQNSGNFKVSINPISTNITSVGAPNNYNNLALMQERNGSIAINLDSGISNGEDIVFELVINNGSYDKKTIITKKFGTPITILDEAGDDTTNWDNTQWGISTTEYKSATSSITDSPNGNYSNNQNKTIRLTNALNLTTATNASLSFYAKWSIENNFDYVQVQVSTNNGTSWIPQCGKYTNLGVAEQKDANNEPLYDGEQNTWVLEKIDLNDYLGENIIIRFQLVTDRGATKDGFYFDDLTVNVIDTTLSTTNFIENNFSLFPNPVKNELHIKSNLPNYEYNMYSIQGQVIIKSEDNHDNSTIDCSNLSPGIYLLKITKDDKNKTFKFIKN